MAERGRIYLWSRNRSFGDGKPRPVVVIAPDAATRQRPPSPRLCDVLAAYHRSR